MEEVLNRINDMEKAFDRAGLALKVLSDAFEDYRGVAEDFNALADYLSSGQWMEDFERDEAGELPADLKRGVLSEDGLYDLLTEHGELLSELKGFLCGK